MYFSEEQIRENYRKFPDEDIIRIAENDAAELNPIVLNILKEEIIRRELALKKFEEFQILDESLLNAYVKLIRNSICPNCSKSNALINVIKVRSSIGILHLAINIESEEIGCPKCLQSKINWAIIKNSTIGLLTFHHAIINIIYSINQKFLILKDEPTDALTDFVRRNYKLIYKLKEDENLLSKILELNFDNN